MVQVLVLALLSILQVILASPQRISDRYRPKLSKREVQPNLNCPDNYCVGTADNSTLYETYLCGDFRLGPVDLPTHLPLSTLFETYDRLGGLCPGEYLSTWTDSNGHYVYPELEGFQLNTDAAAIKGNISLGVGSYIDRFGGEATGYFVSPAGAPYIQRALPPQNLNTFGNDRRYPGNYHVYQVVSPITLAVITDFSFVVSAGPIAPWFGQTGQGTQYKLYDSVAYLLANGYLRRVHRAEY